MGWPDGIGVTPADTWEQNNPLPRRADFPPARDAICGRCGADIYYDADRGTWTTVYIESVDPRQCPDHDAGVMVNDGHYPDHPKGPKP